MFLLFVVAQVSLSATSHTDIFIPCITAGLWALRTKWVYFVRFSSKRRRRRRQRKHSASIIVYTAIKYFPHRRQFWFCLDIDKDKILCLQLHMPRDGKNFSQTRFGSIPCKPQVFSTRCFWFGAVWHFYIVNQSLILGVPVSYSLNYVSWLPDTASVLCFLLTSVSLWVSSWQLIIGRVVLLAVLGSAS